MRLAIATLVLAALLTACTGDDGVAARAACDAAVQRLRAIDPDSAEHRILRDDELAACRLAARSDETNTDHTAADHAIALYWLSERDFDAARNWLTIGAGKGHVSAILALGLLEKQQNPALAVDMFERTARSGTDAYRVGLRMLAWMAKQAGDDREQLKWHFVIADSGGEYLPDDFARLQAELPADAVGAARRDATTWIEQAGYAARGWPAAQASPSGNR